MIEHDIQKTILSNCSFHADGASFTDLKPEDEDLENDKFNYHLQYLVKNDYLKKDNSIYFLTEKGKSLVTNIDHATKQISTNFKVSIYAAPVINNKILLYKRLKHPQYGYTGMISGKITYGDSILDTAKRELKEETNLDADFKIIGAFRQVRKNEQGEVIEDGTFYTCYTDKISGELAESNKEGEYFWVDLEKVSTLEKIFKPSLEMSINEIQNRLNGEVPWESKFIHELFPQPENY